jgi:serine/threonine-protein kinase
MLAVLDAVSYAHDQGIIHRDLKPANVLLAKRGGQLTPKVTDFGIAKIAGGGSAKKSTHADARMGTLTYSSPEQLRSPKDVTPRSDVFSLGAMLYEIATGHLAFPGDNDYDVMDAIIKGRYVPPEEHHPAIDPVIAAVIRKALELDPAKRFASCKQMADALTVPAAIEATPPPASASPAAASPAPPPARPSLSALDSAPAPPRDTLPGSRRPGVWLGLAAVVLVGGGVAMFAARGGGTRAVADNPRDAGVCAGDAAICTSPPAATCATPTTLRTFAAAGTCTAAKGGCSYSSISARARRTAGRST